MMGKQCAITAHSPGIQRPWDHSLHRGSKPTSLPASVAFLFCVSGHGVSGQEPTAGGQCQMEEGLAHCDINNHSPSLPEGGSKTAAEGRLALASPVRAPGSEAHHLQASLHYL